MPSSSLRDYVATAFASLVFLLIVALSSGFYDEDALIIFRFARNFAEHGALVFNPTDPTYSLTCPAWGALVGAVAAMMGLGHQARAVAIVLATVFGVVFLWQIGRLLRPAGARWQWGGLLVMALDPYFVWCAAVGNELPAFLVLLLSIFAAFAARPTGAVGWLRIGAAIALAYLLRPEAVLLVPVLGVVLLVERRSEGLKPAFLVALAAAVAVMPWLVFAQMYYGQFVPLTVEAKSVVAGSSWIAPLRFIVLKGGRAYGLAAIALLVALVVMRDRGRFLRMHAAKLGWIGAVVGFYLAGLREPLMANRYLVVFGPILAATAIASLRAVSTRPGLNGLMLAGLGSWVLALATINVFAYESRKHRMHAYEPYLEVCRWMDANLDPDARVFVSMLGGAGWYTDLHLVDNGIVSREALQWRKGDITLEQLWQRVRPAYAVMLSEGDLPAFLREVHASVGTRPRQFRVVEFNHGMLDEFVAAGESLR